MVDEIAHSAKELSNEKCRHNKVHDLTEVCLFAFANPEKNYTDKTAQNATDDGDATVPNCNHIDKGVSAVFFPVGGVEILLGTDHNVQQSCHDNCKGNHPQEELNRIVKVEVDALTL